MSCFGSTPDCWAGGPLCRCCPVRIPAPMRVMAYMDRQLKGNQERTPSVARSCAPCMINHDPGDEDRS